MPKRKSAKRRAFVRGGILGMILAALIGCGPPPNEPVLGPCTAGVTTFYEGDSVPCRPEPPQRVDIYLENDGVAGSRTATCNDMGGVPTTSDQPGWDRCRTIIVP